MKDSTKIYSEILACEASEKNDQTVVLIHGLSGACALWDPVSDVLRQRFQVIRYELRGHGESGSPEGPWTLDDFVADLLEVLKRYEVYRIHLSGFSIGGLIAQRFAIDHQDKVARLAIVSEVAGGN